MKIDTSSYYPKSTLGEDDQEDRKETGLLFPETESLPSEDEESDGTAQQPSLTPETAPNEPPYDPTDTERFLDNISTTLSWILVPLLMPVYGVLLAFNLSVLDYMSFSTKLVFTLIVAGINVAIPALLVVLLKKMGLVDDLGLNGRKERFIPYIITIVAMAGTGAFLWSKHAPMWLVMFFAGGAAAGLVNMIVNFRWKISAHSAAIAGIVALLIRIMHNGPAAPSILTWLIIWIALAGLLGSGRVWLGRHTPAQVIAGYAVGFLSVFFMTMIG